MRACVLVALVVVLGCDRPKVGATLKEEPPEPQPAEGPPAEPTKTVSAGAELKPLGQSTVSGSLRLSTTARGVRIEGEVRGLSKGTVHGFHVHETGDCSAPDGASAGPHFNPKGHGHGGPGDDATHLGDLGNITADANGVASVSVEKAGAILAPGETSYVGRAIIVHRDPDDLKSQPAGAAGARIACGVVRLVP